MAETQQPKCGSSEIIAEVDDLFRAVVMSGVSVDAREGGALSYRNQTHGDHARGRGTVHASLAHPASPTLCAQPCLASEHRSSANGAKRQAKSAVAC